MTPHLNPDVVAAAGGHDGEPIARRRRTLFDFVLDRPHLAQHTQRVGREHLGEHAFHGAEAQGLTRQLHGTARRHHVGLFAHVQHERVTVTANDGGQ